MATITMDTSEYEALQKNIQLLEESKERERSLHKQIQDLKDEAMQELLNNSRSVSMIKQTNRVEHIYLKKTVDEVFRGMDKLFSRYSNLNLTHLSDQEKIDLAVDAFFKIETRKTVEDRSVVTKGFDEVRTQFEAQYKAELDADTKKELNRVSELESKIKELSIRNLDAQVFRLDLEKYKSECNSYKDKYEYIQKEFSLYKSELRVIFSKRWTIFNYGNIKKEIKSLGLY